MSVPRTFLIGILCLLGGLQTMARPVSAATATPTRPPALVASLIPVDVTSSAIGVTIATAAERRFAGLGLAGRGEPLAVWTDAAGVLVAPRGTTFDRVPRAGRDGRMGIVLVPRTRPAVLPASFSAATHLPARRATGPAWTWVAQACFSRSSDVWSWLDHCYQLYGTSEPDGFDYWELLRYGTAGANLPWTLHGASIGTYATTASAAQVWAQWSPLGDQTGPCQTISVQITSPVAGISWPVNRCDTWAIRKGVTGGSYDLTWSGQSTHGERGLAFVIAVRVARGAFAQWALPGGSNGAPF
jgi:hypothetical protein